MGADFSVVKVGQECNCCAPEEDGAHEYNTQVNKPVDPVSSVFASVPQAEPAQDPYRAAAAWGSPEEEQGFFVPPPSMPEPEVFGKASSASRGAASSPKAASPKAAATSSSSKGPPVVVGSTPKASTAAAPPAAAAPKAAPAPPAPKPASPKRAAPAPKATSASRGGGNFEAILSDLEGAEQVAYSAAFKSLGGGQPTLQPDHEQLRNFILFHSGVGDQDLDTELLKIASTRDDFSIDANCFVMLLREQPISDSQALNLFMNVSTNGENFTAEDCRTCLLQLMNEFPEVRLPQDQTDRLFDTVMTRAGISVSMEEWIGYAKTAARVMRLVAYAQA